MAEASAVVRLPRSSGRECRDTFVKLLWKVDPGEQSGYGFEGPILKPGAWVNLWPTPDFPKQPIVLEAFKTRVGGRAAGAACWQYVLWRFETDRDVWVEIGRARSVSWQWAVDLRPLAVRALSQAGPAAAPEFEAVAARVTTLVARELDALDASMQGRLLGVLHDALACREANIVRKTCGDLEGGVTLLRSVAHR